MSNSVVSLRLRELVQSIITNVKLILFIFLIFYLFLKDEQNSNNDSSTSIDCSMQSARASLVQQLCLLQRFYLNELYTNAINTSPDLNDTVRDLGKMNLIIKIVLIEVL